MLSDKEILKYMQIPDDHEVLFNEWAALKKFLRKSPGRIVVSRNKNQQGTFCWHSDLTKSGIAIQHIGARIKDLYSIMVKGRVLSFSWSGMYRFEFESESRAGECYQILNSIRE